MVTYYLSARVFVVLAVTPFPSLVASGIGL
jgi:hypothetical protein